MGKLGCREVDRHLNLDIGEDVEEARCRGETHGLGGKVEVDADDFLSIGHKLGLGDRAILAGEGGKQEGRLLSVNRQLLEDIQYRQRRNCFDPMLPCEEKMQKKA